MLFYVYVLHWDGPVDVPCMVSAGMKPLMLHYGYGLCYYGANGAMLCMWSPLVWSYCFYVMCVVSAGMEPLVLCYVCGLRWYGAIGAMLYVWSPLVWSHWCDVMCVVSAGMEPLVLCFVMLCELYDVHVSHVLLLLCGFPWVWNFAFNFSAMWCALVSYIM